MDFPADWTCLAQGKTKKIWAVPDSQEVLIVSGDDLTAGDGARRSQFSGKGALATTTTCHVFNALRAAGISTHFIEQIDPTTFRAVRCAMLPYEVVLRRLATGSYLMRNPDVPRGHRFTELVLEVFQKDDARHDPLVVWDFARRQELLFRADTPLKVGFLSEEPMAEPIGTWGTLQTFEQIGKSVFRSLEMHWARRGVSLVDLKIEFGRSAVDNRLIVADVIDNDSWRLWPDGDKAREQSKQLFRDGRDMVKVEEAYRWVAKQVASF